MLKDEVKDHLTRSLIPFWQGLRDADNGGYYGILDYDLTLDQHAEKGCILNSRILWFFSNAYDTLKNEKLLEYARYAYDFMMTCFIDKNQGGVYWSLNYDGTILDNTKHTYNQAFAIYALSSYHRATGDEIAKKMALSLFDLIETKCRDEFGYCEAFNGAFEPIANDKLSENGIIAQKTMNTLLHVFEAYTELYRITKKEVVADRLKALLDIFAEKVYNSDKNRQEVFFDNKMNSLIDIHSYGHDIETAWLIDWGCEVLGNQAYIQKMTPITRALETEIYRKAFDGNSLSNECVNGEVDTTRVWWVQAETMVGFFNAYQKNNNQTHYLEAVRNIWAYIKKYLIDARIGSEWFWEVDKEGVPNNHKPIVEPWKCPYHNGRMCFEVIRRSADVNV